LLFDDRAASRSFEMASKLPPAQTPDPKMRKAI
jgi:hypothetical protein